MLTEHQKTTTARWQKLYFIFIEPSIVNDKIIAKIKWGKYLLFELKHLSSFKNAKDIHNYSDILSSEKQVAKCFVLDFLA